MLSLPDVAGRGEGDERLQGEAGAGAEGPSL